MSQPRIISLIASSTEIVCALGLADQLVGRSHECDYPDFVKQLPQVTSPKFKTDGTSYEIDQRVKALVQEGLSVYRVDAAVLARLKPTHIITQDQCHVCAVSLRDVEQAVCQITGDEVVVVSLKPHSLADIFEDVMRVGAALSAPDRAYSLVRQLTDRMDAIAQKAKLADYCPKVASIEWIDPLMSGGNWMPELIAISGGVNLYGQAGKHSPAISWNDLNQGDPDVIVVVPCGFDIKRTWQEMHLLESNRRWSKLKAVRTDRVFVADGNAYFNRPGPRIVESCEIMAEILHPELFSFGHSGSGFLHYACSMV